MKKHLLLLGTSLLLICCQSAKQEPQATVPPTENATAIAPDATVTDYLHVPGPVSFSQVDYILNWSSHPSETYYKHEYLPKGENPEHYSQMIMLEMALGDLVAMDIAKGKADEINGRKGADPLAGYTIGENKGTGEVLLDFMLSEGSGETAIAEWNSYRYKTYVGPSGQKGIMLFALSKRGYGADVNAFAADMKANHKKYVAEFEGVKFPEVKL